MCRKLCSLLSAVAVYGIALSRGNIATRASFLLHSQASYTNYFALRQDGLAKLVSLRAASVPNGALKPPGSGFGFYGNPTSA